MVGTRGVPAAYGGFETAIEEVGRRLVTRGHQVRVYTRNAENRSREHLGMDIVHLPALPQKQLETLSHSALSSLHLLLRNRPDVAFLFNAANAPFLPMLRAARLPAALHMDGLEWKRSKWGGRGKAYYRWAEQFGVRQGDALIADAPGIADYYRHQFGVPTEMIRYGAPLLDEVPEGRVRGLGLTPGGYHLVVARFEPENHVLEIVEGYRRSSAAAPLVVVGSAPYSADYTRAISHAANGDPRIRLLGGVYDQGLLDALYFHALTYVHGHSVGGTNPSLLRAIGAGTPVIAYDVGFNREVLDEDGWFFSGADDIAGLFPRTESDPSAVVARGRRNRAQAARRFSWDDVATAYEDLALRLAAGDSIHSAAHRSRRRMDEWVG
ncbi:glycosyltransferase [Brachybacterium sp. AOP29-B2-41]|uniref:glycosyltransferase n=1 Tax=Brachybacterium sp. AOP29-B2-41 TaxID=3457704 RepID=UPI00403438F0